MVQLKCSHLMLFDSSIHQFGIFGIFHVCSHEIIQVTVPRKYYPRCVNAHEYPSLMILDDWYIDCVLGCIWLQNFMSCPSSKGDGMPWWLSSLFPQQTYAMYWGYQFQTPEDIFCCCLFIYSISVSPCISTIPLFFGEIPRVLGKFHCHVRYPLFRDRSYHGPGGR